MGGDLWEGEGELRLRWGNIVDGLHIRIWNRTKKPLAIALNGAGRGPRERNSGGVLTSVQYKPIWNYHNESPLCNKYILILKKNALSPYHFLKFPLVHTSPTQKPRNHPYLFLSLTHLIQLGTKYGGSLHRTWFLIGILTASALFQDFLFYQDCFLLTVLSSSNTLSRLSLEGIMLKYSLTCFNGSYC
jgi:hypothetical protein